MNTIELSKGGYKHIYQLQRDTYVALRKELSTHSYGLNIRVDDERNLIALKTKDDFNVVKAIIFSCVSTPAKYLDLDKSKKTSTIEKMEARVFKSVMY